MTKKLINVFIKSSKKGEDMKDQIISDLKEQRMTLKTLASNMDCSYEHLIYVLNGQRPMTYKVASKLCDSLNKLTSNTYHLTDFGF